MRQVVGIELGREPVPDEMTICTGRHLLEAHPAGAPLVAHIREYLAAQGLTINRGVSWMPPSSVHPVRRRIAGRCGIRRGIR